MTVVEQSANPVTDVPSTAAAKARYYWNLFLAAYAAVDPGTAFDLTGDPPQFIRALEK